MPMAQPPHNAFLSRVDEVKICAKPTMDLQCHGAAHTPAGPAENTNPNHQQLTRAAAECHPLALPIEAGGLSMHQLAAAMKHDAALQERLIETLGRILDNTVTRNDCGCRVYSQLSRFESNSRCPMTPSAYLDRIQTFTAASPCNFVVGLIYLQRLRDTDPENTMKLTSFNIQRYLLTAIMLATKNFDDYCVSNKQWALIGDLDLKEMNTLELDMIFALSFSLSVTREEYDLCRQDLDNLDNATVAEHAMQSLDVKSLKAELAQTCVDPHPNGPLSRSSSESPRPGSTGSPQQTANEGPQSAEVYEYLKTIGIFSA